ncbi:hypothetical protein L21SP3_01333 [Sedimentisphaera cyanobacteriorum]|uniref:Protein BatD n=1 Tax=Sedimentisphaera cyanobacteriorum TaxID=1940790 RepID=A0A1Q2HQ03_9BACT|nr:hypothetical protein [Sedimentisphaera cyanobacteriorum]AQQ09527.1 hypothetical protein L21SP3_01333 [Sedimentisphaera cyanobacteriorum]
MIRRAFLLILSAGLVCLAANLKLSNEDIEASLTIETTQITFGSTSEAVVQYSGKGEMVISRAKLEAGSDKITLSEKSRASSELVYEIEPEQMGSFEVLFKFVYTDFEDKEVVQPFGKIELKAVSALTSEEKKTLENEGAEKLVERISPEPEPAEVPINKLAVAAWAAGLILAAAGIWLFISKRRKKAREEVKYALPHKSAYRFLEALKFRNQPQNGQMKEYVFILSSLLRSYIQVRFSLPATDMTTEEFLEDASGRGIFTDEQRKTLQSFLEKADLVKFAGFSPSQQQALDMMVSAKEFIRTTEDYNFLVPEDEAKSIGKALEAEDV